MTTIQPNRFIDALNLRDREDAATELWPAAETEPVKAFLNAHLDPAIPEIAISLTHADRDEEGELLSSRIDDTEMPADELLKTLKDGVVYPCCSCDYISPTSWWYSLEGDLESGGYKEKSIHLKDLNYEEWRFLADYLGKSNR